MGDNITGRNVWDVIDNNMFIIGMVSIIGLWHIHGMWQDWCVAKTTERIALAKLESKKTAPPEPSKDEDDKEDC